MFHAGARGRQETWRTGPAPAMGDAAPSCVGDRWLQGGDGTQGAGRIHTQQQGEGEDLGIQEGGEGRPRAGATGEGREEIERL